MPDSRGRDSRGDRRARTPSRRLALVLALAPAAILLLTASAPDATPTPSPSPSESPTASPPALGTLQVLKTDLSGARLVIAGAKFNVHRGSRTGPVATTLTTSNTGVAAKDLVPDTYCLEETAAPPGFQVAPNYTPNSGCIAVQAGATAVISAADPPVNQASPSPSASPSASPTPMPTGEIQITKVDTGGRTVTAPGFTFNIRVGSATGQVIATIATDGSGIAVAGALNPATYCVEEISAADGYQLAPSYSPSACVAVKADPTQGRSPTVVTVTDPPAPTPTPTAQGAGGAAASPSPGTGTHAPTSVSPSGLPAAAVSKGLIGFGVVLLLAGGVLIAVAIRRRRAGPPPPEYPQDIWYDSTIT